MKKSVDEHAERFSEIASAYDDEKSDEYNACAELVIAAAAPGPDDVVLDLGTGTGAIALALAPAAKRVIGRDISEGMLDEARRKAAAGNVENVAFGYGEFRDPNLEDGDGPIDVVVSNFALHHLDDDGKRDAVAAMADTGADRIVLGDLMFFEGTDVEAPFYGPAVDDPASVGTLVEIFTDLGFAVVAVDRVHEMVGVIVAHRIGEGDEVPGAE